MSLTIQGVLYRYVPGLTKQPVPHPRIAIVQWATFVAGAAGLVAGFCVPLVVLGMPDHLPPRVFALLNGGTLLVVVTLLAGWSSLLPIGGGLLALAGGLYAAGAGRTLLFTVRDPPGRPNPLAVLP